MTLLGRFALRRRRKARLVGSRGVEFTDHGKVAFLEGERLGPSSEFDFVFWFRPKHSWSGCQNEQISEKEKIEIKRYIEESFRTSNLKVLVELS